MPPDVSLAKPSKVGGGSTVVPPPEGAVKASAVSPALAKAEDISSIFLPVISDKFF